MDKTLLVGLDAACWEYLDPLLKAGRLPTIQGLMNPGSWGTLTSTMPPWTPTAWSSLVTGKNPGKHGIFDMLLRTPGSYEFIPLNAQHRRGKPFWHYLNDVGVRVGLVNIPFSHPPAPLDGFMVCGFGTPDSARDLVWPPESLEWIEERFGRYRPIVSTDLLREGTPEAILEAEKKHQAHLIQISAGLADHFQVDVLAINLMLTDHANHKMPRMELVHEAYVQADADIKELIDSFQPDNILLISDHGSSRLKGDFLLNVWLRDHGYCLYTENSPAQQRAALNWILKQWTEEYKGWYGRFEKALRRLTGTILPWLPGRVQQQFWARIEKAIPQAESHVRLSTKPDFARTPVFPGSLYSGLLYVNSSGHEADDVLWGDNGSLLTAKLRDELSEIREPATGDPLFSNIYTADQLYSGSAVSSAPDLVVDAYRSQWNIRTRQPAAHIGTQHGPYFVTFDHNRDYGWHSPEGVFIFSGKAIQPGRAAMNSHLMDVPATLLYMYDAALPEDWDGQVMLEQLAPDMRRRPARTQPGDLGETTPDDNVYSSDEADSMLEHLRALGYLD